MNEENREQTRLLIAVFIVATSLAVQQLDLLNNGSFIFHELLYFMMLPLHISALIAFLFVLSKAVEIRYTTKKVHKDFLIIEKYKSKLYNLSIFSYIFSIVTILSLLITMPTIIAFNDSSRSYEEKIIMGGLLVLVSLIILWSDIRRVLSKLKRRLKLYLH